jgi:hypothetical protein
MRSFSPPRARSPAPRVYTPPTPGGSDSSTSKSQDKGLFRTSTRLEPTLSRLSTIQLERFSDSLPPGQNAGKLVQALVSSPAP